MLDTQKLLKLQQRKDVQTQLLKRTLLQYRDVQRFWTKRGVDVLSNLSKKVYSVKELVIDLCRITNDDDIEQNMFMLPNTSMSQLEINILAAGLDSSMIVAWIQTQRQTRNLPHTMQRTNWNWLIWMIKPSESCKKMMIFQPSWLSARIWKTWRSTTKMSHYKAVGYQDCCKSAPSNGDVKKPHHIKNNEMKKKSQRALEKSKKTRKNHILKKNIKYLINLYAPFFFLFIISNEVTYCS